jgi:hypothetical protein
MLQRILLEAEEVDFDAQDRIDLSCYRWQPDHLPTGLDS